MPELRESPSLKDFQDYVREMKKERGFSTDDKIYECFLLTEEVGELYKAIRKAEPGGKIDPNSAQFMVAEELADIFIYLLSIANQHNIDLEQAFRDKEEINKQRTWKEVS